MFDKKIKKVIIVEGMRCEHCAKKIEEAFVQMDSIIKAKVNLKKKQVIVTMRTNLDDKMIEDVIDKVGYQVIQIYNE